MIIYTTYYRDLSTGKLPLMSMAAARCTALLKTNHCGALTSGGLLKWPVKLKIVISERESHSWVTIQIFSRNSHITRLLAMKEKPKLICQILLRLKQETQYYRSTVADVLIFEQQRYFYFHHIIMHFMMLVIMRRYKNWIVQEVISSSSQKLSAVPPLSSLLFVKWEVSVTKVTLRFTKLGIISWVQ